MSVTITEHNLCINLTAFKNNVFASSFHSDLQFPLCMIPHSFLGWYVCNDRLFMSTSLNQTTSFSFHLRVYTHGLGVHKAASGACCYVAQSQGPKHGIVPLACHCRYPHIHWCCTSGTDKSLPHRYGLRWLV